MLRSGMEHTSVCVREQWWNMPPGRLVAFPGFAYSDGAVCVGVVGRSVAWRLADKTLVGGPAAMDLKIDAKWQAAEYCSGFE